MPETGIYVAPDGCRIRYERYEGAGPLVLLVPGLGGDSRFWSGLASELQHDHRIVATDHRGAGLSDRPAGPYSIEAIAEDVAGLIGELGEPVHLVGHSTGGAVAQHLAIRGLDSLESVVISASWARPDARFRALFKARATLLEAGLTEAYQALTDVLGHTSGHIAAFEPELARGRGAAAEKLFPLDVALARIDMLFAHDCLDRLANVDLPVLVMAARDDILLPPAMSRLVAEAIPDARYDELPGAHFHPAVTPAPMAEALRSFWKTLR